ncbi:MAG: hypothetical protein MI755_06050 [Sphingomonadales bacterium]|nr:hypothetical protein [Sphingomonadales bacterium]
MRRLYLFLGAGIVLLGLVHMLATFWIFGGFSGRAVWFFSGGMMMALIGALNLLNRAYGRIAPGLRTVCIAATAAGFAFATVAGVATGASIAQFILALGLFGGAAALSLNRRAVAV